MAGIYKSGDKVGYEETGHNGSWNPFSGNSWISEEYTYTVYYIADIKAFVIVQTSSLGGDPIVKSASNLNEFQGALLPDFANSNLIRLLADNKTLAIGKLSHNQPIATNRLLDKVTVMVDPGPVTATNYTVGGTTAATGTTTPISSSSTASSGITTTHLAIGGIVVVGAILLARR